MVLIETWVDEKVKGRLPERYKWRVQKVEKKNRKERVMGG